MGGIESKEGEVDFESEAREEIIMSEQSSQKELRVKIRDNEEIQQYEGSSDESPKKRTK